MYIIIVHFLLPFGHNAIWIFMEFEQDFLC